MLERISDSFVTNLKPNTNEDADKDYLKVITKPFTNLIIQVWQTTTIHRNKYS